MWHTGIPGIWRKPALLLMLPGCSHLRHTSRQALLQRATQHKSFYCSIRSWDGFLSPRCASSIKSGVIAHSRECHRWAVAQVIPVHKSNNTGAVRVVHSSKPTRTNPSMHPTVLQWYAGPSSSMVFPFDKTRHPSARLASKRIASLWSSSWRVGKTSRNIYSKYHTIQQRQWRAIYLPF